MYQSAVPLLFIQAFQEGDKGSVPPGARRNLLLSPQRLPANQHAVILHELEGHHIIRQESYRLPDGVGNGNPPLIANNPIYLHLWHPSQQAWGHRWWNVLSSSSTGSMMIRPRETLIWMVEYRSMPTSSSRSAGMAIRTLSTTSLFDFCMVLSAPLRFVHCRWVDPASPSCSSAPAAPAPVPADRSCRSAALRTGFRGGCAVPWSGCA